MPPGGKYLEKFKLWRTNVIDCIGIYADAVKMPVLYYRDQQGLVLSRNISLQGPSRVVERGKHGIRLASGRGNYFCNRCLQGRADKQPSGSIWILHKLRAPACAAYLHGSLRRLLRREHIDSYFCQISVFPSDFMIGGVIRLNTLQWTEGLVSCWGDT